MLAASENPSVDFQRDRDNALYYAAFLLGVSSSSFSARVNSFSA
jgi:hypothetical protein